MILMNAARDFFPPDCSAPEFVPVSPFGHQNIATAERVPFFIAFSNRNVLDHGQVEMTALNVRHTKVRQIDCLVCRDLLALGYAANNDEYLVEARKLPSRGELKPHFGSAQLGDCRTGALPLARTGRDLGFLQSLRQFRRRFVLRILRQEFAAHGEVEDGLADLS